MNKYIMNPVDAFNLAKEDGKYIHKTNMQPDHYIRFSKGYGRFIDQDGDPVHEQTIIFHLLDKNGAWEEWEEPKPVVDNLNDITDSLNLTIKDDEHASDIEDIKEEANRIEDVVDTIQDILDEEVEPETQKKIEKVLDRLYKF